ncbi:MAG TPA: hypothetical protein VLA03_09555 [Draconibacterium sp.]|nr:hypothetical protein [Draconibacterium sp.]
MPRSKESAKLSSLHAVIEMVKVANEQLDTGVALQEGASNQLKVLYLRGMVLSV